MEPLPKNQSPNWNQYSKPGRQNRTPKRTIAKRCKKTRELQVHLVKKCKTLNLCTSNRTSTICRSGNRARPSRNLSMSSRKDFGRRAGGPTKSNQSRSSHSSLSCSSSCSSNSPSRFGATRTRRSSELNPSYTTAFPGSNLFLRSQHTSAGQSRYLRLTKILQILLPGDRVKYDHGREGVISSNRLRCLLGRKGVADLPPLACARNRN